MSEREPPPRRGRQLSVTITGPEGMLEAMAKLLRDDGYIVTRELHEAFDVVLASYLADPALRTVVDGVPVGPLMGKTTALDIVRWCAAKAPHGAKAAPPPPDPPDDDDADWLEHREFYELMYAYRTASVVTQSAVVEAFEAVKRAIRQHKGGL